MAINIPLALLFAFAVLYLRGKSANLLSIGAVDFGIIVDSSVIMVESIYRRLSSGEDADLPLKERILRAAREVERSLFFSTLIMVCALLPLFTMTGPEGQIFGPMADTYAFALGGALLLALTLSPVLCRIFMQNVKPAQRQLPGARAETVLSARSWTLPCTTAGWALGGFAGWSRSRCMACRSWAASSCPAWKRATSTSAARFRSNVSLDEVTRPARARSACCASTPRSRPCCARSAGPTTAPIRPASTTPSSSCRSSRGRMAQGRRAARRLAEHASASRADQGRAGRRHAARAWTRPCPASIGTSRS